MLIIGRLSADQALALIRLPVTIPSDNVELLTWFQPQFEAVFLLLHPFLAVSPAFYEQFAASDDLPTRQEWRTLAQPILWSAITAGVGFPHRGVLHRTLLQRSRAIRGRDTDMMTRLEGYLRHHSYLEPTNGVFDELLLDSILDACALVNPTTVYLASEFEPFVQASSIDMLRSDPDPRLGKVQPVLWTYDRAVLFCVHWDSYYTCVAGPRIILTEWAYRYAWEGFFAEPGMFIFWDTES